MTTTAPAHGSARAVAHAQFDERHPGDIMRVVLGLAVLVVASFSARGGRVGETEADLFQLLNRLPDLFEGPLTVVMQAGALAAVGLTALLAAALRRLRLARDLVLSGILAWFAADIIKHIVERGRPATLLGSVTIRGVEVGGFGFPSGHVAVAAGLATAAAPYLGRSMRRLAWTAVVLVGVARIYVGAHLPVDVFGGAALGWILGSVVHLAFGAPGGRPALTTVRSALLRAGLPVTDLAFVGIGRQRSVIFSGQMADGTAVFCRAVGRDQRDADLLSRSSRFLAFRDVEDENPFVTAQESVEHEAYLSLRAARAGVRTPEMLLTSAFEGGALVAERAAPGKPLAARHRPVIDDGLLADLWAQVQALQQARLAHGSLRVENVFVDDAGHAWLVAFTFGEAAASDRRLAIDIAELLASLAALVGAERTVRSAAGVLGGDALVPVLPLLQPVVLTSPTRKRERAHKGLLEAVRKEAAATAGVDEPKLEAITRVRPATLLMAVVLGLAVHVLLPQIGELPEAFRAIRHANPGWLVVAGLASAGVFVAGGLQQIGAVRIRVAFTRATVLQLASAFSNRLTPASVGGLAVRVRFLERCGLDEPAAVSGTALSSIAGGAVHFVWLVAVAVLAGDSAFGRHLSVPSGWPILVAVVLVLSAVGILLFAPRIRHLVLQPVVTGAHDLIDVVRRPTKALQLFGGAVGQTGFYLLAFGASLAAVGADVPAGTVMLVYLGGTTVAGASPTPGGLGAVEAALVAGLTAAGTQTDLAVAGVLVFRMLTYWAPILPGWLALRGLRRAGLL